MFWETNNSVFEVSISRNTDGFRKEKDWDGENRELCAGGANRRSRSTPQKSSEL